MPFVCQDAANMTFEQRLKAEREQADRTVQQLNLGLQAAQDAEREARMRRRQLQSRAVTLTGADRDMEKRTADLLQGHHTCHCACAL